MWLRFGKEIRVGCGATKFLYTFILYLLFEEEEEVGFFFVGDRKVFAAKRASRFVFARTPERNGGRKFPGEKIISNVRDHGHVAFNFSSASWNFEIEQPLEKLRDTG